MSVQKLDISHYQRIEKLSEDMPLYALRQVWRHSRNAEEFREFASILGLEEAAAKLKEKK